MTDREKIIAAYMCSNEKLPDERCEKCPFGYEYLDQIGDNYFVGCNTERMMVDAIDMLRAQGPVEPTKDENVTFWYWRCGRCGVPITIGDKFCRICGRGVKWHDKQ